MEEEQIKSEVEKEKSIEKEGGMKNEKKIDPKKLEVLVRQYQKKGFSEETAREMAKKLAYDQGLDMEYLLEGTKIDPGQEVVDLVKKINEILNAFDVEVDVEPTEKDYLESFSRFDRIMYNIAIWLGVDTKKIKRKYEPIAKRKALERSLESIDESYRKVEEGLKVLRETRLSLEEQRLEMRVEGNYLTSLARGLTEVYKRNEEKIKQLREELNESILEGRNRDGLELKQRIITLEKDNHKIKKKLYEILISKKKKKVMSEVNKLKYNMFSKLEMLYEQLNLDVSKRKAEIDAIRETRTMIPEKLDENIREFYNLSKKYREQIARLVKMDIPSDLSLSLGEDELYVPDQEKPIDKSIDELYKDIESTEI
ncbi:hypothetical protein J7K74_00560 [Candidatus Woesearchaeota archaeon]|nr:hypothetical protein [Candidatus Woesearchaeota archaeon]